jgi:ankyrin repeat protein
VPRECIEKCTVCGDSRVIKHQYVNGKCARCGADVNAPDGKTGIPPLILAAFDGEVEEVRALLKGGANVNICTDETPLMAAARKGYDAEHVEIVKILLAHGADVNATDPLGSSAVRLAQRKGLSNMVNLLESHGGRYLGA